MQSVVRKKERKNERQFSQQVFSKGSKIQHANYIKETYLEQSQGTSQIYNMQVS